VRKEGLLLTVTAIVIVIVFVWPHLDPYHCYIVHQRKDGSCPRGYIHQNQIGLGEGKPGNPFFTEPDGTGQYACFDLRTPAEIDKNNPGGVGLGKDLCVDFLRPGEKSAYNPKFPPVIWN